MRCSLQLENCPFLSEGKKCPRVSLSFFFFCKLGGRHTRMIHLCASSLYLIHSA